VDTVVSSAAILSLSATGTAPVITTQPVGRLAAVETGVIFSVVATGSAGLTYQWKKDGGALAEGTRITGSTTATLSVANLAAADAGSYSVVVANGSLSTTSSVAALTVVDVRATHAVAGPGYVPGGTVTVNSTVTYAGPCVGLGWTLLLPEGWTYASGGGAEGETKPPVGTPSLLEWAWTNIPASPVTFSTTLNVPTGAIGAKTLAASAIFRIAAGPLTMMVKPDPLTVSAALYHSADTGRDLRIGLVELTRVIELYNTRIGTARTGCYKIEVGSEDGFSPESTRTASTVVTLESWHSADSNRDGKIGLLELTRVIELYNYRSGSTRTGAYHLEVGTEDGFAPGPVAPAAPDGMVLIPAGTFTMGSVVASIAGADKSDGLTDATPHAVTLSAFYVAKTETTYADWVEVRTWARDAARGAGVYDFGATLGAGKGDAHPVQTVSWYDVVKWCNAKSEREGLTPVYYTNDAQTAGYVYRTGNVAVTAAQVKWGANGYRLPTEAEWEYAARGGLSGQRFPWGDTITHVQANYSSHASYAYDVSTTRSYHPTYATGGEPYTSPVGVFAVNGYGLSDMVGNVWEWTWDWYGSYGSGAVMDPRGAASGSVRVFRGSSWGYGDTYGARSAYRDHIQTPDYRFFNVGFRPARSSVP
jgi:formylglycine-generating enzyme required for sulfatase activity